ncbi:hypothetical protein H0G86_010199 [Trichoderma simmonsii]|uniref:Uncharacterized protein n=1 Tax=Trichoderma simmonsii TaxID=1491479 RepID=A0A8G0LKX3_9HYPO|nr:hypothetical protein H0G86_010199 [Trichoderma simmonsii]
MASFVLWGTRERTGEEGEEREQRGERPASLIEHRLSASSASSLDAQHRGIWPASSVQLHQITAQHATTATTSPEHHAPCAPVLPEPLQFSPPLQPPSRELQIAMPWHKCKQASCTLTLCACPSHTSPPSTRYLC